MAKQVKSGYILHYKKRLFGKDWREEILVLYDDSSLAWYRDRDKQLPDGGVRIRDAPELLAAGQWAWRVPNRPEMPNSSYHNLDLAMAVGAPSSCKAQWFITQDTNDLLDWMKAINSTLPPPPLPPVGYPDTNTSAFRKDSTSTMKDYPGDRKPLTLINSQDSRKDPVNHLSENLDAISLDGSYSSCRSSVLPGMPPSFPPSNIRSHKSGLLGYNENPNWSRSVDLQSSRYPPSPLALPRHRSPSMSNHLDNLGQTMMMGGVVTQWGWGTGLGWINPGYCGTCAMQALSVGVDPPHVSYSHAQYEDDPDCDIGDAELDFGDLAF